MPGPPRDVDWGAFPTTDPTAPKPKVAPPQRDWSKASWGDVAGEAMRRLVPTYAGDMWNGLKSLATMHGNPETGLSPSGGGMAMPIINMMAGQPAFSHQQGHVNPGEAAQGVNNYYYHRYTAPGALKTTLATDPGGALMDAQGVATALEGGEALTGGTALRTLNHATNPAYLAGTLVAGGAKAAQTAIRGGAALDKTGAFTPAALQAVQAAFPNGEITAAELANPKFKSTLAAVLQQKGINPAAVKQAVLQYNGVQQVPRSVVTGQRVPSSVAQPVTEAIADGKRAIAAKAQAITGAPAPDPTALGGALNRAHDASAANVDSLYKTAAANPGTIQPVFADILHDNLADALGSKNLPTTSAELSEFPDYEKSPTTLDFLTNRISKLAGQAKLTLPNIEKVRQSLNGQWRGASGNDAFAISTMKGALDKSVSDALGYGFMDDGDPDFAGQDYQAARSAASDHATNFENRETANPVIRRALGQSGDTTLTGAPIAGGDDAATQGVLSGGFFTPSNLKVKPGAPKLYNDLSGVLDPDGQQALDDHIRQTTTQLNDAGTGMKANPAQIRGFLDGPMGTVFSPEEQSDLRLAAAGNDVLNGKMTFDAGPSATDVAGRLTRSAAMGAAGWGAGHLLGISGGMEPIAGIVGAGAEQALEPYVAGRRLSRQMSGAPAQGSAMDAPQAAGSAVATGARTLPVIAPRSGPQTPQPTPPDPALMSAPPPDLSTVASPYAPADPSAPVVTAPHDDPWAKYRPVGASSPTQTDPSDLSNVPSPYDTNATGQASGGRIERASGGKVEDAEIERLVNRLMHRAKEAKKSANKATEPLLKAPDSAVAKALDVAQRAI